MFETQVAQQAPEFATPEAKEREYAKAKTTIESNMQRLDQQIQQLIEDRNAVRKEQEQGSRGRNQEIRDIGYKIEALSAEKSGWQGGLSGSKEDTIKQFVSGYTQNVARGIRQNIESATYNFKLIDSLKADAAKKATEQKKDDDRSGLTQAYKDLNAALAKENASKNLQYKENIAGIKAAALAGTIKDVKIDAGGITYKLTDKPDIVVGSSGTLADLQLKSTPYLMIGEQGKGYKYDIVNGKVVPQTTAEGRLIPGGALTPAPGVTFIKNPEYSQYIGEKLSGRSISYNPLKSDFNIPKNNFTVSTDIFNISSITFDPFNKSVY
jgi:hypothetical protein